MPSFQEELVIVSELMQQVREFIGELRLIPRRNYADSVLLGLLSKSVVTAEAIALLSSNGHSDEAFGLCRTSVEIELIIRYLTNTDTIARCERYVMHFSKEM